MLKDKKNAVFSPYFGDFRGLCPLFMTVGATECLLDDTLLSAKKAHEAGVDVKVLIHPHGIHDLAVLTCFPEGKYMCQRNALFINKHLD